MSQGNFTRRAILVRDGFAFSLAANICGLLLVACGAGPQSQSVVRSDEDLFRGVVLASGPVAEAIPAIRDYLMPRNFIADQATLANIEVVQDLLIARIKQRNPAFLGKFRTMVESGDELEVQRALMLGARGLVDAVLSMDETGKARAELENPTTLDAMLQANAQNGEQRSTPQPWPGLETP